MNNRQIDALVAEKVMGWRYVYDYDTIYTIDPDTDKPEIVPKYSTDIVAAWQVVEKLPYDPRPKGERYYECEGFTLMKLHDGRWFAGWYEIIPYEGSHDMSEYSVVADTAPMAICLAALKAVGVEIPDA